MNKTQINYPFSLNPWERIFPAPVQFILSLSIIQRGIASIKQDDDNDQVLLVVEEGGANPNCQALELKSTNVKAYDENHIISPKERRELRAASRVAARAAGLARYRVNTSRPCLFIAKMSG